MSRQKFRNTSILIYLYSEKSVSYSTLLEVAEIGPGRVVLSQNQTKPQSQNSQKTGNF